MIYVILMIFNILSSVVISIFSISIYRKLQKERSAWKRIIEDKARETIAYSTLLIKRDEEYDELKRSYDKVLKDYEELYNRV